MADASTESRVLYHVSEHGDIRRFDPRPNELVTQPVVWAIDAERLRNYLVPRDCPRVAFYAGSATTEADRLRFLRGSSAVMIIEHGWLERLRTCRLYCYSLPANSFELFDEGAGYYVSYESVTPSGVTVITDALAELARRSVELRTADNLWPLSDAVAASTLQFSIIRMRNAMPPPRESEC